MVAKNLPVSAGDMVGFLGREDPLDKQMATHSSTLGGFTVSKTSKER